MLENMVDKRVLLIAFILMLFLAIPSSFAGDSFAMDTIDSTSDAPDVDEVVSVEADFIIFSFRYCG